MLDARRTDDLWRAMLLVQNGSTPPPAPVQLDTESSSAGLSTLLRTIRQLPSRPHRPDSLEVFDGSTITIQLQDSSGYQDWAYDNPDVHGTEPDRQVLLAINGLLTTGALPKVCRPRAEINQH